MNWAQFKDAVFYLCLADSVVAYRSLTQEVADPNPLKVMTNILSTVSEFNEFNESFRKNSNKSARIAHA